MVYLLDGDKKMEIQLQLKGNSESFVLQMKEQDSQIWQDKFWIEQDDVCYCLHLGKEDMLIFKNFEEISKRKRLVAKTANSQISFFEEKYSDHLFDVAWWHGTLQYYQNNYRLRHISSGTKGDIIPVAKNNQPIGVFTASNLAVAGKKNVSLYINDLNEIDACLILYLISYVTSIGFLDIDALKVRYRLFYQFSDRKALTVEHLEMLPQSRRPKMLEATVWYLLGTILIGSVATVALKQLLLFLVLIALYYSYILIRNLRDKDD